MSMVPLRGWKKNRVFLWKASGHLLRWGSRGQLQKSGGERGRWGSPWRMRKCWVHLLVCIRRCKGSRFLVCGYLSKTMMLRVQSFTLELLLEFKSFYFKIIQTLNCTVLNLNFKTLDFEVNCVHLKLHISDFGMVYFIKNKHHQSW